MTHAIKKTIFIGSDHAGFALKSALKTSLQSNYEVIDLGTHSEASVDYPDFAHPVAEAVGNEKEGIGILICGSANGVAIAANKHAGIRAAICWEKELAALARSHNNANILCLPSRFISENEAEVITDIFLNTPFEGGRHYQRVDKIG